METFTLYQDFTAFYIYRLTHLHICMLMCEHQLSDKCVGFFSMFYFVQKVKVLNSLCLMSNVADLSLNVIRTNFPRFSDIYRLHFENKEQHGSTFCQMKHQTQSYQKFQADVNTVTERNRIKCHRGKKEWEGVKQGARLTFCRAMRWTRGEL